jgi:hypothetical protein
VVLGNGQPFDSCPIDIVREGLGNRSHQAEAYQVACLIFFISSARKEKLGAVRLLTVVAKALSGRAHLSIVANVAALVAGTA